MVKKESTKAEQGNEGHNGRQQRITELATRLDKLLEQANKLPEKDSSKKSILVRVDDLSNRVEFWQNYLKSIEEELKTWDKEVDQIDMQLSGLEEALVAKSEEDQPSHPGLPTSWRDIEPDVTYQTADERKIRFSKQQINLGKKFDKRAKHLKAIEVGHVPPDGRAGIVPSEMKGFDKKTKVKGKGGDYRFQARYEQDVLYFPGLRTFH